MENTQPTSDGERGVASEVQVRKVGEIARNGRGTGDTSQLGPGLTNAEQEVEEKDRLGALRDGATDANERMDQSDGTVAIRGPRARGRSA